MNNFFRQNEEQSEGKKKLPDGRNGPFRWTEYSFPECLLYALSDPVYPVAIILLLIYACIGNGRESLLVLMLFVIKLLFSSLLRYIGQKRFSGMNASLIMPADGERNGIKTEIFPWNAEENDIIHLKPGVIVPADCEIMTNGKIRVMEPYFDYDAGRRAVRTSVKFSKSEEDVSSGETRTVYAGSTVLSGRADAAVFSVGTDTSAASRLGGLKIAPSERYGERLKKVFSAFNTVSVILLIAVIPSMLIFLSVYHKSGAQNLGLLPALLLLLSMICGCVSEKNSAFFDYIIANDFRKYSDSTDSGVGRGSLLIPSSADRIAFSDTLVVFDKSVFGDLRTEVRSVFFDSSDYSGDMIGAGDLNGFAERALVLSAAAAAENRQSPEWEAFQYFADLQAIDREYMLRNVKSMKSVPCRNGETGVRITYRGDQPAYDTITVSYEPSKVNECRYYRQKDGSLGVSGVSVEEKAAEFIENVKSKCQVPMIFTSKENGSDNTVLEGIAAVGGVFPENNRDVCSAMSDFGINTILVIQNENPEAVFVARMSGIADEEDSIAIASEYEKEHRNIEDGFERRRAFIGFGREGTEKIIALLKEKSSGICSVPSDPSVMRTVARDTETLSVAGSSCGAVGIGSSARITRTAEHEPETGLSSFFTLILTSVGAAIKSALLTDFLVFRTAMLSAMILIPFWAGKTGIIPDSFILLFSILFSDIMAVFSVSLEKILPESGKDVREEMARKKRRISALRCALTGILSGLASSVTVLIFSDNPSVSCGVCILGSLLLVPCAALGILRLDLRKKCGLSGFNTVFALFLIAASAAVCAFAVFNGNTAVPEGRSEYYPLIINLLISVIPSIVTSILMLVSGALPQIDKK